MSEALGDIAASALPRIAGRHGLVKEWHRNSDLFVRRTSEVLSNCSPADARKFHDHKNDCESPIEALALATLFALLPGTVVVDEARDLKGREDWTFAIVPQMKIHGYRLDFGVLNRESKGVFDLELDGRAYHMNRRKDTDRTVNLWGKGIITHRVDGSALCRNPYDALTPFARKVRGFE